VAMMSYKELLGEKIEPAINKNIDMRWISIHRDVRASAEYVSKKIIPLSKIAKSYLDFPIYVGDMRYNDLGLTFYLIKNLLRGIFRRIFKRSIHN
jgi:hypothetical protein